MKRRNFALGVAVLPLAACGSLNSPPKHTYYELQDLGEARLKPAAAATSSGRSLLVSAAVANAFYDGTGLVYSRTPGARAYYQLASWTDRPAVRVARLLERRLAATGVFANVSSATAAVRADWLLELVLEQLYHDDTVSPGMAEIDITAEIIDWRARRLVARRRFLEREPVAQASAAGAVAAFNVALTRLLDDAGAWVVAQAQSAA